jgi:hypothetical protein
VTGILHGFPLFECVFDRQKIFMLAVIGMLFDGSATGEIAAAFFPRRTLAAISASSKNCLRACAQHSAAVIAPGARDGS